MVATRKLLAVSLLAAMALGLAALMTPTPATAAPDPPNCNGPCKPFVWGPGKQKCFFVGCDIDGICRYIC